MLEFLSNVEPAGESEIASGFPLDAGASSDDDGPTVAPPAPAPRQEAVLAVFTELLQLILRRDLESRIRIRVDSRLATRATLEAEGVSLFALLSKAYVLTEWIPTPDLLSNNTTHSLTSQGTICNSAVWRAQAWARAPRWRQDMRRGR